MTKRRAVLIVSAVAIVTVCAWFLIESVAPPRLRVENFAHVRVGITQAEVEELLGGPPGNYGRNRGDARMTLEGVGGPPGSVERRWHDDTNLFEIFFDEADRVVVYHKRAGYQQIPAEGVWPWVRRQFGL